MGNDGGVKLSRKDLTKSRSTASTIKPSSIGSSMCHLSGDFLQLPIVSDYRGNLYNKISILEYLTDRESVSSQQRELVSHIAGLRDVIELKGLKKVNGSASSKREVNDGGAEVGNENDGDILSCSITGDILGQNGAKFGYIADCGDAFSVRSLKELNQGKVKTVGSVIKPVNKCPLCEGNFEDDNLIIIGATGDDLSKQEKRYAELIAKGLTHSMKKRKGSLNGTKTGKSKKMRKVKEIDFQH